MFSQVLVGASRLMLDWTHMWTPCMQNNALFDRCHSHAAGTRGKRRVELRLDVVELLPEDLPPERRHEFSSLIELPNVSEGMSAVI